MCGLAKPQSKRGLNSDKILQMISTWPEFYNALPFCKLWTKLMHPFKNYWSETKSVTQPMTTLTMTQMEISSLCIYHALQATQKSLCFIKMNMKIDQVPVNIYSKTCLKRPLKKKSKKLVFKADYRLMQVKSNAECSERAFCNTFDLH